jgi:hypothetical protein
VIIIYSTIGRIAEYEMQRCVARGKISHVVGDMTLKLYKTGLPETSEYMRHTAQITRCHVQEDKFFIITATRVSFTKHFLETIEPRGISCDSGILVDNYLTFPETYYQTTGDSNLQLSPCKTKILHTCKVASCDFTNDQNIFLIIKVYYSPTNAQVIVLTLKH